MPKNLIPCYRESNYSAFIEYAHKPRILIKIWFIANYFYSLMRVSIKKNWLLSQWQKRHRQSETDFFPDKHSLGMIPNLRLKADAKRPCSE